MVDVINELTDLTDVSKQGLKLMKILILRALGAQGGYLELARPCHRITLIELDLISSTSHYYLISCLGVVPDGSGIEFSLKMTISLTTNRT